MDALSKAIELADGVTRMAEKLGLRQSVVSNWKRRGQVPAERCLAIEQVTGGEVTRYELRPDVFGTKPSKAKAKAA